MNSVGLSSADGYLHLKPNKEIQLIILGGGGVKQGEVAA